MARFSREELGEKCEKHILQEIAEETERRARFSGQLRERFTVCTEIEEYRSIKCWHKNRGGVLLHRNRGEVRPAFNVVRLHLFAQKSRCCTTALNAVRSGTEIEAELLLVLAHFSRRK